MNETKLKERVDALLASAIEETSRSHALRSLHRKLLEARERMKQPMRVAIVGLIKAGKSTMMNALLGETVVATGTIEATFNVNWLRYGPTASLRVHFKENRPPETRSLEDLERLTRRSDEYRDYLLSISYIEVFYPNAILQILNLIDTPGLASVYRDDSQGTIEFLKLHGPELTKTTKQEASNADAVLYLFSHSIAAGDKAIVEMFQGPMMGHASPINSIGVLTKVDAFWPDCDDALEGGHEIVERLQNDHPQLRRLFYSIEPMCGLLAWGAQTLTNEEFETLKQLAALPEGRFQKILNDAERFTTREYPDVPISLTRRAAVLDRLGQYGIWHSYHILKAEVNDKQRLTEKLLSHSGLEKLKNLILAHFGNRAYLIKLDAALRPIYEACFRAKRREDIQGLDRNLVERIEGEFGQLKDNEFGFSELDVLRDYYQGKLPFTPKEVQQLLQITGEFGTSDRQRLGLPEIAGVPTEADLKEVLQTAQDSASYWRRRAIDPGASRETERAAGILGDAYDRIRYQTMETIKRLGL